MKKTKLPNIQNQLLLVLFIFSSHVLFGQQTLPIPKKKSFLYSEIEKDYYQEWCKSLRYDNSKIQNIDTLIREENHLFWNRFVTYFKIGTDEPNDILIPFKDAVEHDKDDFCYWYNLQFLELAESRRNYYKKEIKIMDTFCNCLLKSYNPRLIDLLDKIKINDQKYRNNPNFTEWKEQAKLDSINLVVALQIFEKYGYPNRKVVGIEHEAHFFSLSSILI